MKELYTQAGRRVWFPHEHNGKIYGWVELASPELTSAIWDAETGEGITGMSPLQGYGKDSAMLLINGQKFRVVVTKEES